MRQLDAAFARLPVILVFRTPAGSRFGPFPLDPGADAEEARLKGEVHLAAPVPATLRLEAACHLELLDGGIRLIGAGRGAVWKPRETIPGTGIVVARRLVTGRRGPRPGPPMAGLARRLGDALELVEAAWPGAHREVLAHTRIVVPFDAKGTVSQSHADRPGVSYINPRNRTRVDLADDLVHETAHHRLHALEELGRLDRDDGEPRYHSPWRRGIRPLRGILHATYTFAYRARLLEAFLGLRRRLPRSWISRELAWELHALSVSLGHLRDAEKRGLLTTEGESLRAVMARRVAGMRRRLRPRA